MSDCVFCSTWALAALAIGLIYLFLTWNLGFWKKRGVKEPKAYPIVGSFPSAFTRKNHMAADIDEIYRKYRNDENFVGVYTTRKPQLLILDPELAHKIYVNDFKNFHDNEFSDFVSEKSDRIFAANPFATKGEKWKDRRNEITPGLTPSRVKNAYPVTLEVCEHLKNYLLQQIKMAGKDGIDAVDVSLRYTCEVTADIVLGVNARTLSDQPTDILKMTKTIFDGSFTLIAYQLFVGIFPGLEKLIKVRFFPKPAEEYFFELMEQSISLRQQNKNDRKDFLNYMLHLQEKNNYTNRQVAAQTMTFLVDGIFTTATAVSHCLLLLARYPKTQEKLREEINENLEDDGTLTHEKLNELPYLDACLHEALRVFPPLLFANKLCTETYELQNKDGSKVTLYPGEVAMVPLNSFHLDEKYYEKPFDFIPERFMGENSHKSYREKGLYFGWGDGPRVCLGMRFALTQSKASLAEIVRHFKITVNPKTRTDNRLDPEQFMVMLDGGIWLDFEPIN